MCSGTGSLDLIRHLILPFALALSRISVQVLMLYICKFDLIETNRSVSWSVWLKAISAGKACTFDSVLTYKYFGILSYFLSGEFRNRI